jgi:hypothetical protein
MVPVAQGEACRFSPRCRAVGFDVRVRVPHAAPHARAPVVGRQLACLLLADRVEVVRRASCVVRRAACQPPSGAGVRDDV